MKVLCILCAYRVACISGGRWFTVQLIMNKFRVRPIILHRPRKCTKCSGWGRPPLRLASRTRVYAYALRI